MIEGESIFGMEGVYGAEGLERGLALVHLRILTSDRSVCSVIVSLQRPDQLQTEHLSGIFWRETI